MNPARTFDFVQKHPEAATVIEQFKNGDYDGLLATKGSIQLLAQALGQDVDVLTTSITSFLGIKGAFDHQTNTVVLDVTSGNRSEIVDTLGHEIAHAVAKHSAEQLTKQQNQQVGTNILGNVLNQAVGSGVGDLASAVAGKYFSFRNLKYSRDNETEADYMGLIFAAMAGYDPQQAIPFWKRMSQGNSSNQNDIFSDHPSDAKRIAALQKEMPTALKYYHPAKNTKKR